MIKKVLVTGATGKTGRIVVNELSSRGIGVSAATRKPTGYHHPEGIKARAFDFTLPETFRPALEGQEGLFLIAPPLDSQADRKLIPVIKLARELGVQQIVLLSAMGVEKSPEAPLHKVELALQASGVEYTILRPNFFMENFTIGFLSGDVKERNGIFLPTGKGKTSFISVTDIGEAAAEAFTRNLTGQAFTLTGPQALDHGEVAAILSRVYQREITYHAMEEEEFLSGARQSGMPEEMVGYLAMLYAGVREGFTAAITEDIKVITGREPLDFASFAKLFAGGTPLPV